MEENIVLAFMSAVLDARIKKDEYTLELLRERGRQTYVNLEDVGVSLDKIMDDVVTMIETAQELQEERLRAIFKELNMNTKHRILEAFEKAEDDLFTKGDND